MACWGLLGPAWGSGGLPGPPRASEAWLGLGWAHQRREAPAKSEAACCSHEHHSHSAEMLIVQSQKNISDDILSRIPRHQHGSNASSSASWAPVTEHDSSTESKSTGVKASDPKFFKKATPIQISELIQERIGSIQALIKKKDNQVSVCESSEFC